MFRLRDFERMVQSETGWRHTWSRSSMGPVRTAIMSAYRARATGPNRIEGSVIIDRLYNIPADKRARHKKSIEYVIWECPGLTPAAPAANHPNNGNNAFGFADDELDRGDLIYGLSATRNDPVYVGNNLQNFAICDQYNNFFGIGTGLAYNSDGTNFLGSTPQDTRNHVANRNVPNQGGIQDQSGSQFGDQAAQFANIYKRGILRSRFSPDTVYGMSADQLRKDHKSSGTPNTQGGVSESAARLREAQWYKGIRRACKAGISMVATNGEFRDRGALVHFLLDGYGDLGLAARKTPLFDVIGPPTQQNQHGFGPTYVPITSSELCFVFRNWNDLQNIVKFYINGNEVQAPWLSQWRIQDCYTRHVTSNYDAWKRYELKRLIFRKGAGRGLADFSNLQDL